jgi:hypothetical protein
MILIQGEVVRAVRSIDLIFALVRTARRKPYGSDRLGERQASLLAVDDDNHLPTATRNVNRHREGLEDQVASNDEEDNA